MWSGPASALTSAEFLASPAAQAYKAGRYADALGLLQTMAARHPDDANVLRLTGMASYKLGRFQAAADALAQAAAIAPKSPATRYWLGAAYHKLGARRKAAAAFRATIALAPGTRFADNAERFLAALDQPADPAESARAWRLGLRTGMQYDDNVDLAPSREIESLRFFEEIDGSTVLLNQDGWRVRADGGAYLSQHADSEADKFNLITGNAGAEIRRATSVFGLPVAPTLRYRYDITRQGNSLFSQSHAITAALEANPTRDTVTRVFYRGSLDAFADDGFKGDISSRDGVAHAAGVTQYVYFDGRRHYVWAGYEYARTETEGDNFDSRGHRGSAGISAALPWQLRLDASAEYANTRYFNFVGATRRRSARWALFTGLSRKLGEGYSAAVSYSHAFDDSNIAALETRRQIVTLSLSYEF